MSLFLYNSLTKELPRGVHQYKFIVDTNWHFSRNHPSINDGHGNINNIIDTSNTFLESKKVSSFNNYYPDRNKLQFDALPLPEGYRDSFSLCHNYRQTLIGNKDSINRLSYFNNENCSFSIINRAPHINMYYCLI
jgi:hypothetical protein